MKRKLNVETTVGIFMVVGILCLAYLSIQLGKMQFFGGSNYEVSAVFSNVGGLRDGAPVVIAGVRVGQVEDVKLEDYSARVTLSVRKDIQLQEDAIASIRTQGLIGEKYIQITPGGMEEIIEPGGKLRQTESAVDLEQLISKYAFGDVE